MLHNFSWYGFVHALHPPSMKSITPGYSYFVIFVCSKLTNQKIIFHQIKHYSYIKYTYNGKKILSHYCICVLVLKFVPNQQLSGRCYALKITGSSDFTSQWQNFICCSVKMAQRSNFLLKIIMKSLEGNPNCTSANLVSIESVYSCKNQEIKIIKMIDFDFKDILISGITLEWAGTAQASRVGELHPGICSVCTTRLKHLPRGNV